MPNLPRKNTLDFNPDSIVLASKKLSAIALERMKNPVEDPDQATLSTLQAQKQLGATFDKLLEMSGVFHSVVLRIQNLLSTRGVGGALKKAKKGGKRMKGGAGEYDEMFPDDSTVSTGSTISIGEFNRNPNQYYRGDDKSVSSDFSNFSDLSGYLGRLRNDRDRFKQFYSNDDRNSSATPASSGGFDFDDAYSIPDSRFSGSNPDYGDDGSSRSSRMEMSIPDVGGERNWNSLIFYLISITRRMNILLSSSVKPVISSLSQAQITALSKMYLMVRTSYDDITRPLSRRTIHPVTQQLSDDVGKDPFTGVKRNANPNVFQNVGFGMADENLIQMNQYGDEILNTFNSARQELLLTLTVIINSWKQNTPTGQQTDLGETLERDFQTTASVNKQLFEGNQADDGSGVIGAGRKPRGRPRKTGSMTLVGNGRNFYGEQIGHSRDLPTIFSGAMRNCPTKYLL